MRSWQKQALRLFIFGIFTINFLSLCIAVNTPLEPDSKGFTVDLMKGLGVRLTNGTSDLNVVPRLMKSSLLQSTANEIKDPEEFKIMPKIQGFSLPSWGGLEFEFRKNITIPQSNVPSNLDDFPVLIDLYRDSDLFGVQQANGNDIMFTDALGNKLAHEIEKFDPNEPHLIAWVKTDLLSSADNIISMYFGNSTVSNQENPTGVWDTNYIGIYHLTEDPIGTIYDSTSNNHDGTTTGMISSDQVEGQIDGSLDFDGNDDNVNLGQIDSNAWTAITLEAWVRTGNTGMLDDRIIAKEEGDGYGPHIWMLGRSNNNLKLRITTGGNNGGYAELQPSGGLVQGKWQHIAMTWDSVTATLTGYIDGAFKASTGRDGDVITDSTVNVFLADHAFGDRKYSGFLDEARISKTARSTDWITTEYANQYDPNSFYTIGQLEGPSAMDFFRYKKTVTIDYTKVTGTTDFNDFVILLDILDPDLHDGNKIESDGSNLIFINPSTNNQLYYEIETFDQNYDPTNGRLVAWVKIDTLFATSATEIEMYYGNNFQSSYLNSENVWSDYEGVWHLNEDVIDEGTAVNVHIDSSINSNDGNQHGNDEINGSMDLGQNFDGNNDYIEMGDPASLELKGDTYYTFSGWFYRNSTTSTDVILDKMHPYLTDYTGYSLWIDGSDGLLYFRTADDDDDGFTLKSISNFNSLPTGWYYYAITFDTSPIGVFTPANMHIYINGSDDNAEASLWGNGAPTWDGNDDFVPGNNLADFTIGAHANLTNYFEGRIDEIRITERLLSPDWINTEYTNQYDPQNFYLVSSEVENDNWWKNDSFNLRKDFRIESQNFGNLEEELFLRPTGNGNDDHYDVIGALIESAAINETVADDTSSYLYSSVVNINRYFSYKIKTPPIPFDGTIDKITLFSHARRDGPADSSNYYNYITWGGLRYYGNLGSLSSSFTPYTDEWTLNPVTGLTWTWKDLIGIEFGARGRISLAIGSSQIQITQMYAIITYTSNKSLWNFPILIDISDPDLKTDIQANGNDLIFYDEVGHKLDYEIVNLISNSSHANLTAFIKVPQFPLSRDSYFSMYYGNQTITKQENIIETWDNDFLAVYHFEESPPSDTVDITGNYNLTPGGAMNSADLVTGMISQALDFDGFNDQLFTTQTLTIDSFTVSSWVKFDTGTGWRTILNVNRSAEAGGIFRDFGIKDNIPFFDDTSTFSFGNALSASTWYHITFSFDSQTSALKCYVNGIPVGTTVFRDIPSITDNFQIGAWNLTDNFNGLIDEVRISDVSRSSVWTSLEYSNQLNPTSFITIGGEYDRAPPIINEFGVDDPGDGNPTFWANVTDQDSVSSVTIELNGSSSSMNLNGSGLWTYQPTSINFNDYYDYFIRNATDNVGNFLKFASPVENITFDYDTINPSVIDWEFYDAIGPYGTFKANVSDSWGLIDGVIVNVTYHEVLGSLNSAWAVMVNTTSGYINNSIDLQQGSVNFTIRVNDTGGNVYISLEHIGYFLNTPPLVENLTLSSDPSSEVLPVTSNSTLYVLYDYFDIEADLESGSEINWYRWNTTHWEFKSAEENLTSGWLVKGDVWRVTVKPQDDDGDFGEIVISGNITIQNSAPVASNVIIYPNNPKTDNILIAYYDWTDTDPGDSQQVPKTVNGTIIQWYRNRGGAGFTLLNAYTNETQIPITETLKGDIFYYNVTPSDDYSYGNQFKSSEITIQNTLPILTIYILNNTEWITSPVTINDTTALEANNTNFDADPVDTLIGLEISWMKYNFVLSKFEWVVNNTKILNPGNTTDGDIWIVNMRIYDGTGYSEWFASSSIRIGTALIPNQLPSAVSVNLTSSNNVTGGFLFANYTFSDPDGDNEGLFTQFKWYKWDSSSNKWVYQSQFSEVTKNLTIAQLIKGDKWKVSVRPQDNNTDYGSWSINSSEMIIGNTAPSVVSAGIVPASNVYTTDTLLANWLGDDVNNDLIILYSIVWINGSIEVSSLSNETEVPSSYTRKGQTWIFKIKLWDGEAWSANFTTTQINILNSLPRLENVTLSGGSNTLVDVTITYDWVDFDGDTIDLGQTKINWTVERGGQVVALINGTWILDNTNFVAGDFVTIQITPHDGSELGEMWAAFRVRITIGNTEPAIDGTPNILDPDDGTVFYASNQLFANYSASDPDTGESNVIYELDIDGNGLVVGAEYQWFRKGVLVSELTSYFVPISYLVRGDIWKFGVRPKDRWGDFGDWVNSSQIIIINSPPVITEFHQINLETRSDMDFELEFIYYDYDADQINTTRTLILWYRNGSLIPGTENGTVLSAIPTGDEIQVRLFLSRDYYSRGDNISVTVKPFDTFDWALQANSSINTTISNSLPYFDEILLIGGDNTSVDMSLNYTFIDFDNDLIDLANTIIKWTIEPDNGSQNLPVYGEWNLSSTYFVAGDYITIEITPHDGIDLGQTWREYRVRKRVGNAAPSLVGIPNILGVNDSINFYSSEFLYVNYSAIDPDAGESQFFYNLEYDENGFVIGAEYRWYRNGTLVQELTTPYVNNSYLVRGDVWNVSVRPKDRFGDYGDWLNSTIIIIINSPPEITGIFEVTPNITTNLDLEFDFLYNDFDNDTMSTSQLLILWYQNGSLIYQNGTIVSQTSVGNDTLVRIRLSHTYHSRGDNISVIIRVFDGYDWAFRNSSSINITIVNFIPVVQTLDLEPNGTDLSAYTTDTLNVTWSTYDVDDEEENDSLTIIKWFKFVGFQFIEQTMYQNNKSIPSTATTKGDIWYIYIQVSDGYGYSVGNSSVPISISNSPPVIYSFTIGNIINQTADINLEIIPNQDINTSDPDNDAIIARKIFWFKNNTHQSQFDNETLIHSSALFKGDSWYTIVSVKDIGNWSLNHTSQTVLIINKAPHIESIELLGDISTEFLVEDEDIFLNITIQDIDQGDTDLSTVEWYINDVYFPQYDNEREVSSIFTHPGENWTATINPYDETDFGVSENISFTIESRPNIENFSFEIFSDIEGEYRFSLKVNDSRNKPISDARFEIFLDGSLSSTIDTTVTTPNGTDHWVLDYSLSDYEFLNSEAVVRITVRSQTTYYAQLYYIPRNQSFNILLADGAAPRVISARFEYDDAINPTTITFYAEIQEFGTGIEAVTVFYLFTLANSTGGNGASISQELQEIQMEYQNKTGNVFVYSKSVDFPQEQADIDIYYRIETQDSDGNINSNAFDNTNLSDRFSFQPPGLPEWVLLIAVFVILVTFVGSIVYVKFIRKPEVRGLDKDLVMGDVTKITEGEIMNRLDSHTIGIVVSFFHQAHGPIPIICVPELLRDNWSKLMELSDRAFSGTQFSDDFTVEIVSNYDFILDRGLRVSVMSFGYSLDRPEARGGQENITANILVHKEIFPLLNQFQEEIQPLVHETHDLMNREPDEKQKITQSVLKLRKHITAIVLSYEKIYGTTELIEEED